MVEGLFQPMHLLIILVIALVVVGPSKLGDVGGQLGRGVRDVKKALGELDDVKRTVTDASDALKNDARVDAATESRRPV